jgi:hypothetical protein
MTIQRHPALRAQVRPDSPDDESDDADLDDLDDDADLDDPPDHPGKLPPLRRPDPAPETYRLSVHLPIPLVNRLKHRAVDCRVPVAKLVGIALTQYLGGPDARR